MADLVSKIRLVAKANYRRIITLHNLDILTVERWATSDRWKDYALVVKCKRDRTAINIRAEINRVAFRFGWKISARETLGGVEVIRYA